VTQYTDFTKAFFTVKMPYSFTIHRKCKFSHSRMKSTAFSKILPFAFVPNVQFCKAVLYFNICTALARAAIAQSV
jgi:hypothetical protein